MSPFSRRPITALHALTKSKLITRCYISSRASQTSPHDRAARNQLLRTIYARAQGLQPSSMEYMALATSGMPMTVYPYPQELPTLMRKFFLFNSTISNSPHHPIVAACRLYSSLLAIHPFCDGNGRVSRAWMAGYLFSRGYPPMMFARAEPRVLTRHLETAQKEQDRSGLYSYVVGEMRAMLEMEAGTGR